MRIMNMTLNMERVVVVVAFVMLGFISGTKATAMERVSDKALAKVEGGSGYYSGSCQPYQNSCPSAITTCTQEDGIQYGQETINGYRKDVASTDVPSTCSGDIVFHNWAYCEENAHSFYSYTTHYYFDDQCAAEFGDPVGRCKRNMCEDVLVLLP